MTLGMDWDATKHRQWQNTFMAGAIVFGLAALGDAAGTGYALTAPGYVFEDGELASEIMAFVLAVALMAGCAGLRWWHERRRAALVAEPGTWLPALTGNNGPEQVDRERGAIEADHAERDRAGGEEQADARAGDRPLGAAAAHRAPQHGQLHPDQDTNHDSPSRPPTSTPTSRTNVSSRLPSPRTWSTGPAATSPGHHGDGVAQLFDERHDVAGQNDRRPMPRTGSGSP